MVSLTSWIEQEKTKCPVEMLMVMLGYVMWQRQEVCLAFPRYYTGHCMILGVSIILNGVAYLLVHVQGLLS